MCMQFIITLYISLTMCAVGFFGNLLYQAQQASPGIQRGHYVVETVYNKGDKNNDIYIDELQQRVLSGIKNTEKRYSKEYDQKDNKQQNQKSYDHTFYDQLEQKFTEEQARQKRGIIKMGEFEDDEDYEYNELDDTETAQKETTTQRKTTTQTYIPADFDQTNITTDLYDNVLQLHNAQKTVKTTLTETCESIYVNIYTLNPDIMQNHIKSETTNTFQEKFNIIISKLKFDMKFVINLETNILPDVDQKLKRMKEIHENISKNESTNNTIVDLTNELTTFYENIKMIMSDSKTLYENIIQKLQNEINDYNNANGNLHDERTNADETITKYTDLISKFATQKTNIVLKINKMFGFSTSLEKCMEDNYDFEHNFNVQLNLQCGRTREIEKKIVTRKNIFEAILCDNRLQEKIIFDLLNLNKSNCIFLPQKETNKVVEKTINTKQCVGNGCENTTEQIQCDGDKCKNITEQTKCVGTERETTFEPKGFGDNGNIKTEANGASTNEKSYQRIINNILAIFDWQSFVIALGLNKKQRKVNYMHINSI